MKFHPMLLALSTLVVALASTVLLVAVPSSVAGTQMRSNADFSANFSVPQGLSTEIES
jgi:hypothetical protein